MLIRKIIASLILILNFAGIGFLIYLAVMVIKNKIMAQRQVETVTLKETPKKKDPKIVNDDIVPDEDDLLKDMDLSDLDNLDLDDFE